MRHFILLILAVAVLKPTIYAQYNETIPFSDFTYEKEVFYEKFPNVLPYARYELSPVGYYLCIEKRMKSGKGEIISPTEKERINNSSTSVIKVNSVEISLYVDTSRLLWSTLVHVGDTIQHYPVYIKNITHQAQVFAYNYGIPIALQMKLSSGEWLDVFVYKWGCGVGMYDISLGVNEQAFTIVPVTTGSLQTTFRVRLGHGGCYSNEFQGSLHPYLARRANKNYKWYKNHISD